MKAVIPGHRYELDNLEGGEPQVVQFIQKEPVSEGSTELRTITNGTTNEEVLDMLTDRMRFLDSIVPCDANKAIITCLEEAQALIAQRAVEREAQRAVERETRGALCRY